MNERHGDGIVSYFYPDRKVSLGFMDGLISKIRVTQTRAYGIKDQEYLMRKVILLFIKCRNLCTTKSQDPSFSSMASASGRTGWSPDLSCNSHKSATVNTDRSDVVL